MQKFPQQISTNSEDADFRKLATEIIRETDSKYLTSRRDFLKTAGSVALFAALGISLASCSSQSEDNSNIVGGGGGGGSSSANGIIIDGNTITLNLSHSSLQGLRTAGGWLLIVDAQTLTVNIDGTLIRAFTSICPHAQCDRNWSYSNNQFICSCHDSRFTNAGVRVSGPAPRNLTEFDVSRDGDTVVIIK